MINVVEALLMGPAPSVLHIFAAGLFPPIFSPRIFPRYVFSPRVFSPLVRFSANFFQARFFILFSSHAVIFPVDFFKQGNQPNQIQQSKTKLKPNLTICNLTSPYLIKPVLIEILRTKPNLTKPILTNSNLT